MHQGLAEDEEVVGVKEVSELLNEFRGGSGGGSQHQSGEASRGAAGPTLSKGRPNTVSRLSPRGPPCPKSSLKQVVSRCPSAPSTGNRSQSPSGGCLHPPASSVFSDLNIPLPTARRTTLALRVPRKVARAAMGAAGAAGYAPLPSSACHIPA